MTRYIEHAIIAVIVALSWAVWMRGGVWGMNV